MNQESPPKTSTESGGDINERRSPLANWVVHAPLGEGGFN